MTVNQQTTSQNELLKTPTKILIRPHTPDEEMDYLWRVLQIVPFLTEHKYEFVLPDHEEFRKLAQISPNFGQVDKSAVRNLFVHDLYDPEFYSKGLAVIESGKSKIIQAMPGMIELNRKWGFKLYPQYSFFISQFGPGGWALENGVTVMRTRKDGTFLRGDPIHTAIHEIVEFGIKDLKNQLKLSHPEKERLVDHICIARFSDIIPDYKFQTDDPKLAPVGDLRLDPFMTVASFDDIPSALKSYTATYPRN